MQQSKFSTFLISFLYFLLISIGLDLFYRFLAADFKIEAIFNLTFLFFEVLLEAAILFFAALGLFLFTRKLKTEKLIDFLLKALVFGVLYGLVSFVITLITIQFTGASIFIKSNFIDAFARYVPNGIKEGLIFLLVFVVTTNQQKIKS